MNDSLLSSLALFLEIKSLNYWPAEILVAITAAVQFIMPFLWTDNAEI